MYTWMCQDFRTGPCGRLGLGLPCGGKTCVHLFPVRAPDCVASPPRTIPSRQPPGLGHPQTWEHTPAPDSIITITFP
jgi:hypothetical protein